MSTKRHTIIYIGTVLLSILFLWAGNRFVTGDLNIFTDAGDQNLVRAKIERISDYYAAGVDVESAVPEETLRIVFDATLLSGPDKGATVTGVQTADSYTPAEIRHAEVGDKVLLYEIDEAAPGTPDRWILQEFVRTDTLTALLALFVLLLLAFGRAKGFHTILSLVLTCLAVFLVFIPAVLSGSNIYATSFVVCLFIIASTLLLVNGANTKSLAAGFGCAGGVVTSGLLVLVANAFMKLTGIVDEQSVYLLYLNPEAPIDLQAVIFSSIIIGALGATLDVSVSIASALNEVQEASANPTFRSLVRSGMNIGRDVMGTMANTLVLAYVGSSLSLVLLLIVNSNSLLDLMNREIIVVESLQTLVGSIGLLCTIPLTSLLSAYVYMAERRDLPNN